MSRPSPSSGGRSTASIHAGAAGDRQVDRDRTRRDRPRAGPAGSSRIRSRARPSCSSSSVTSMSSAITPGRLASPALARSSAATRSSRYSPVDQLPATDRDDAVDDGPVAGLVRLDHVLDVLAEARPELGRHELQLVRSATWPMSVVSSTRRTLTSSAIRSTKSREALGVRGGDRDRLQAAGGPGADGPCGPTASPSTRRARDPSCRPGRRTAGSSSTVGQSVRWTLSASLVHALDRSPRTTSGRSGATSPGHDVAARCASCRSRRGRPARSGLRLRRTYQLVSTSRYVAHVLARAEQVVGVHRRRSRRRPGRGSSTGCTGRASSSSRCAPCRGDRRRWRTAPGSTTSSTAGAGRGGPCRGCRPR